MAQNNLTVFFASVSTIYLIFQIYQKLCKMTRKLVWEMSFLQIQLIIMILKWSIWSHKINLVEHFRAQKQIFMKNNPNSLKCILKQIFIKILQWFQIEQFRALKPSPLEHFRALKCSISGGVSDILTNVIKVQPINVCWHDRILTLVFCKKKQQTYLTIARYHCILF